MTHTIDPGFRRATLLSGVFFLVVAVGLVFVAGWDGELSRGGRITAGCAAVACAVTAWWCFHFVRRADRYEVEITDFGIRVGQAAVVPWSAIVRFRERPDLHRVDLLGTNGETLAKIEYQIEKADEVIAAVAARLAKGEPTPDVFGKRRPAGYIVVNLTFFAVMTAGAVWLWMESHHWIAVVMPPVIAWALYSELRKDVRQLTLQPRALIMATFLGETVVPMDLIERVELTLRPLGTYRYKLACLVHLRSGGNFILDPRGVDVTRLYQRLRYALQHA